MSFACSVVTPEQQRFDGQVTQAIVPAHDGLLGILTNRAPLLVKLGLGPLRIDLPNGQHRHFFIDGGVAQMKNNALTILTNEATPASEIDAEASRAEYNAAIARRITDEASFEERQKQIARGQVKERLARQP
jgi:F-type H+-transporting ATPase subunit epsilon